MQANVKLQYTTIYDNTQCMWFHYYDHPHFRYQSSQKHGSFTILKKAHKRLGCYISPSYIYFVLPR